LLYHPFAKLRVEMTMVDTKRKAREYLSFSEVHCQALDLSGMFLIGPSIPT